MASSDITFGWMDTFSFSQNKSFIVIHNKSLKHLVEKLHTLIHKLVYFLFSIDAVFELYGHPPNQIKTILFGVIAASSSYSLRRIWPQLSKNAR